MSNTAPLPAASTAVGPAPGGAPPGPAPPPPGPGPTPPPPGPGRSPVVVGLALVGVALLAGLVWFGVRGTSESVAGTPRLSGPSVELTAGEFDYTVVSGPKRSGDCAGNAYGDVAGWFADNPCESVARGLYTTRVGEARALVSVVLVTMPDATQAGQLKAVTDTDGTGNVNDLVRDESVSLPDAPNVARGEYHSRLDGRRLTIVETAFYGDHTAPDALDRISKDAPRLAALLRE